MGVAAIKHHNRQMMFPVRGFSYDRVLKKDITAMHLRDDVKRWLDDRGQGMNYDVCYDHDLQGGVRFLFTSYPMACLFKLVWG